MADDEVEERDEVANMETEVHGLALALGANLPDGVRFAVVLVDPSGEVPRVAFASNLGVAASPALLRKIADAMDVGSQRIRDRGDPTPPDDALVVGVYVPPGGGDEGEVRH